jgi:hypothetical protein
MKIAVNLKNEMKHFTVHLPSSAPEDSYHLLYVAVCWTPLWKTQLSIKFIETMTWQRTCYTDSNAFICYIYLNH